MHPASARSVVRRCRRTLLVASLVAALSAALASPGVADDKGDLRHKQRSVTSKISGAKSDLDESSAGLVKAARALGSAQKKLTSAQQHLSATKGQLVVAKAQDTALQAKLVQAQKSLSAARLALVKGKKDMRRSKRSVVRSTVESLQNGSPGLRALGDLLNGADPTQFSEQMSINESVSDAQTASLDGYDASRVLLKLNQVKVTKLRDQVAAQRARAAANLTLRQSLESAAQKQTTAVAGLVTTTAKARQVAAVAKRDDLAQLDGLEKERNRIGNQLKALAVKEARAEARARAKAAAAAAAAAAKAAAAKKKGPAKSSGGGSGARRAPKYSKPGNDGGYLSHAADGPITSPYGLRFHPILHVWKLHDGTDFGVPCGTPVRAAADGKVIDEYFNAGYGNRVILNHGRVKGVSLVTTYNHLSRFVAHVGQRVKRGQLIAYSGTTGYSTGCHLHFMVIVNGVTVNPMGWL